MYLLVFFLSYNNTIALNPKLCNNEVHSLVKYIASLPSGSYAFIMWCFVCSFLFCNLLVLAISLYFLIDLSMFWIWRQKQAFKCPGHRQSTCLELLKPNMFSSRRSYELRKWHRRINKLHIDIYVHFALHEHLFTFDWCSAQSLLITMHEDKQMPWYFQIFANIHPGGLWKNLHL